MVSPTLQKILIASVVLLLVLFLGYKLFSRTPASSQSSVTLPEPVVGQDILDLVDKLKAVNFDISIFSDSLMTNLRDLSPVLQPESQGRVNPFFPIGQDPIQP